MATATSRTKRAVRELKRREADDLPDWETIVEAVMRSKDLEIVHPAELRDLDEYLTVNLIGLEPIGPVRYTMTEGGEL